MNINYYDAFIWDINQCGSHFQTLKAASAQIVKTSVTNNSPSQDSNHPDDLFQSRYQTLILLRAASFSPLLFPLMEAVFLPSHVPISRRNRHAMQLNLRSLDFIFNW